MLTSIRIEDIEEELQGFNVKCDEDCLLKLKEYCCMYQQEAEEIVEHWVAYSFSNSNCNLTIDHLDSFHRDFLVKELTKASAKQESKNNLNNSFNQSSNEVQENGVIDAYLTPDAKKQKIHCTPDGANKRSLINSSPAQSFSPSSFSPSCCTPSQKYQSRINSSEILSKFGDTENSTWKVQTNKTQPINISHLDKDSLTTSYSYMFEKLRNKAIIADERIDYISDLIKDHHSIEQYNDVKIAQSGEACVVGQICCDGNGKMNDSSVMLEGSVKTSNGMPVSLDVKKLPEYSFFPGQIAAFSGINPTGQTFTAQKIFLPPAMKPENMNLPATSKHKDLQVVIACGPFATKQSLSYEPFYDLVKYILEYKPHVCILIGPFVDCRNQEFQDGNVNENPEALFKKIIMNMLKMTETIDTQFVLVASSNDMHHHSIYPTPPFAYDFLKSCDRLFLAPDPCLLSIEGVIFAITATDILLHLGKEEIYFPAASPDRLRRLVNHLLLQQSFYPLNPPSEEINIDYEQADKFINIPVLPHVLITPSDFRNFIKDVNNCCCVNPERITKGMLGGTFARMRITLPSSQSNQFISNVCAEILRI